MIPRICIIVKTQLYTSRLVIPNNSRHISSSSKRVNFYLYRHNRLMIPWALYRCMYRLLETDN